jgi:ribonuclease G
LVEVSPGETRAALVDAAGRLCRLRLARLSRASLIGGIYLGRVVKVERGMGAAFVDIGLAEPTFLGRARSQHEGEALVVQVVRDAWNSKAASVVVTPRVEGRYLALAAHRGDGSTTEYERNIVDGAQRARLEAAAGDIAGPGEAIHIKAAAQSVGAVELAAEAARLRRRWQMVRASAAKLKPPQLLEAPAQLVLRLLREIASIGEVVIDDLRIYSEIKRLTAAEMPDLVGGIAHHGGDRPLFDERGIDEQIDEALERCLSLPSGVSLTIDRTEALTAIDVDLGGGAGAGRQEEECTRANLDAIPAIARQIAVRNLAGLIVIDFISMRNKASRRRLVEALRKALRAGADGAVDVLGMTAAGLVEITRQRKEPALADLFSLYRAPTPDPEALACAALRQALRMRGPGHRVLCARPDVIAALEGPLSDALVEAGRHLGEPLALRPEARQNGFEIVLE